MPSVLIMTLMAAATATGGVSAPVHQATVGHLERQLNATYKVQWQPALKEIAPKLGTRTGTSACRWQANIFLHRSVTGTNGADHDALARPVHHFSPLSGTEAGGCDHARYRIEAQLERHARDATPSAEQIALQDADRLHAEAGGS